MFRPPGSPHGPRGPHDGQPPHQEPPQYPQQPGRDVPRTVYLPPVAHTAPAPYPYAGGAPPDPRSVGPAWSVPAQHRPPPVAPNAGAHYPGHHAQQHGPPPAQHRQAPRPAPAGGQAPREDGRRARRAAIPAGGPVHRRPAPPKVGLFRRLVSALFTFVSAVVLLAGAAFVTIALLDRHGVISVNEEDLPVILPEQPIAIPPVAPLALKTDKTVEGVWSSGTCGDFSKERDLPAYQAGRNSGSAQALRGKTAALAIKLHSPNLAWTKTLELNVDRASMVTQRFYLAQAKARGIALTFDVIPWSLKTTFAFPKLALDGNQRLGSDTMDLIRDGSRGAIEGALGARLDRVVNELRKSGYQNVALMVFLPVKTSARSFAVPSYRSAPTDYPEAAYLFVPSNDFGHFSVTVAHEGMHLFGADDLYRVRNVDKRDDDDVMGEYCTGFLRAKVGDATAFAIGWLGAPPPRGYKFDVK